MDDEILLGRAAAGDLDAFGELYDRYVDAVYDLAWRTLRDGDRAAAALRETFATATEGLGAGSRRTFASWLFGIAHHAVLSRTAQGASTGTPAYEEAFGAFDVPDPARIDPRATVSDPELPPLAWEAARELSGRDYALLDLSLRRGLAPADLAPLLHSSPREAATVVRRMHKAAAVVLGGFMIARRSRNCEDLRHLLARFEFPPYGNDVREAVDAHIAVCPACQTELRAIGDPLAAFAALATLPVPLALKADAWRDVAALWPERDPTRPLPLPPALGASDAAGAGFGGFGGGCDDILLADAGDGGNRILLFAVAVLALVVFGFAVAAGVLIAGGGDDDDGTTADGTETATAETGTPQTTRTAGVVVETSTPEPVTDTPVPVPTDTPPPATDTPPPPPPVTDTPAPTPESTEAPAETPTVPPAGTPAASPTPG